MEFAISQPKVVRLPRNEKQTFRLNSRPQMWPMVWIYQIVTGVTSVVGVPSTHLVINLVKGISVVYRLMCDVIIRGITSMREEEYVLIDTSCFEALCNSSWHTYTVIDVAIIWKCYYRPFVHDDVIKWRHFGVTDPLWGESPVTRSFDFFFDLRLNKRVSKQSRRRDAIVLIMTSL